jgi:hypothetical protein
MHLRLFDPADVEPLVAFLQRADVAARKLTESVIEIDPPREQAVLLLAIWKAMHPESDFAWA